VFDIFFHCHNCSSHDENPNQMQMEADWSRNLQEFAATKDNFDLGAIAN
jgi:hypothetical protein